MLTNRDILKKILEAEAGILPLYKPAGWTSFEAVRHVRSVLGIKKIGHTGTLDPFAEGLLLLCIGSATKLVPRLMDLTKTYWGILELGKRTDTFDVTGRVTDRNPVPPLTRAEIKNACRHFIGEITQVPPMFSALKVRGKRLYSIARKGEQIARTPRAITIEAFGIKRIVLPHIEFSVTCSKGTYVRSLVDDFGIMVGCGAYLKMLKRIQIGSYTLRNAIHLPQLEKIVAYLQNNGI